MKLKSRLSRFTRGIKELVTKKTRPSNLPIELFTLMVVLGRSIAGVSGYSKTRRGLKMKPSFLETSTSQKS